MVGDDDPDDDEDIDTGDFDEPVGSCDECGVDLYGDERYEGLCDQCSWRQAQARGDGE